MVTKKAAAKKGVRNATKGARTPSTRAAKAASTTSRDADRTSDTRVPASTPDDRLARAVLLIAGLALLVEGYALVRLLAITVAVPDLAEVATSFDSAAQTSSAITAAMAEVAKKLDDLEGTARTLPGMSSLAADVSQVSGRVRKVGKSTSALEGDLSAAASSMAGSDFRSLVSLHAFLVVQTIGLILLLVALLLDAAIRLGVVGGAAGPSP